ncbi:MAG: AbrB/MazE/SpoVT family DNA-binding domain-containing protein [Methanocellales archaeon]|nr:AbrB/MazE/SpoVT family DNA-binding domain-containing protein [Methanocellales archaeon]MDI6902818.1 AbrB/MazE/SpoVT family DNA-binding domain-containing protein [Methanocellales archaeon]
MSAIKSKWYVGKRGQVTLPKVIREEWGIEEGDTLTIEIQEDELIIKRKVDPMKKGEELRLGMRMSEKEFKRFRDEMEKAEYQR